MPRTYGKILCTIWTDPDFLELSDPAKVLYLSLLGQPDITAAGIVPLVERRWRRYLTGGHDAVTDALDELETANFVLVDDDTAEVLVRSFVRHDGRIGHPKLGPSVHNSINQVQSTRLKNAIKHELDRVNRETPGGMPFDCQSNANRSPIDSPRPRPRPETRPSTQTAPQPEPPPAGTPTTTDPTDDDDEHFNAIIDAIVGIQLERQRNIRNPTRWAAAVKARTPTEHGHTIRRLTHQFPHAPATAIAAATITGNTRQLAHYTPPPDTS